MHAGDVPPMTRDQRRIKRILFCTDTWPPQVNGVSVVTALSVQGLAERGWRCAVVAPRYPRHAHAARGLPALAIATDETTVPSVAAPGYSDLRLAAPAYGTVADAIDRFEPDIVHSATEFMIGRLGQLAAGRRGITRTSSYHTDFSRYAEAYGFPWLRSPVSRYIGRFHRRSARVYTPGGPAREDLLALGVTDAEVWGRGVDTVTFTPTRRRAELRSAFGMESRFTFLYVGRFAAEKNVQLILEAYARALAVVPRGVMRLILAGSGPLEPALRHAAPPDVSFLGHLDREDTLPDLYANCDAFAFASTTETLGLVVLEAMASGLPVIAAPAGGVADHLRDGVNGIACAPGDAQSLADAMVRLAGAPIEALALGEGARRTAEELTWESELDRLDESYRRLIAPTHAPMAVPPHRSALRQAPATRS
jgi:phosphatidylinositol alpha 1,6-mannosyltransferase